MKHVLFLVTMSIVCILSSCDIGDKTQSDEINLANNIVQSNCGGFEAEVSSELPSEEECRTGTLSWVFDDESGKLSITLSNIKYVNCAARLDVEAIQIEENNYSISIDVILGDILTSCLCFYDVSFEMTEIKSDSITFSIPEYYWEGEINVAEGSGEITIIESIGYCD